nr:PREDICTED: uncharacterized protein LOC105673080 isoform X2 [Linepithema humile]XP_012223851.1 PREDICTED: uncharacterized protein LOC105673080 isoform X2 [Linepithema humile]
MFASPLVKHVLPYRSDTMSWESRAEEFSWINENYLEKKSKHNFQVKCKTCRNHIKYAKVDAFKKHMSDEHQSEVNMECDMQQKYDMWKYFNLTKKGKTRCIVCDRVKRRKTSNGSLKRHISKYHNEEKHQKPYESQDWAWKYINAEKVNNFFGKCKLCDTKMRFPLMLEKLRDHLRKHDVTVDVKRDVEMWKTKINGKLLWLDIFYTIAEEDFRAKCKDCGDSYLYVSNTTIEEHMSKHKDISDYEKYMETTEEREIGWKGMRFIDDNAGEIECMVCHIILANKLCINDHEKLHSKKLLRYHTYWGFKYMRQLGDLAKCSICEENVILLWDASHLRSHTTIQHAKEAEELCRAFRPSPSCTVL